MLIVRFPESSWRAAAVFTSFVASNSDFLRSISPNRAST